MEPKDFQAYYWAGVGVLAVKFGIKVEWLFMGDHYGLNGEAMLEPVEQWCDLEVDYSTYRTMQLEDYVTTLLAGSAASFMRVRDRRCPIKRSLGDAGLEMKFLREVWQCFQREPDRAVEIICGSLGKRDDGDVEPAWSGEFTAMDRNSKWNVREGGFPQRTFWTNANVRFTV